MHNPSLPSLTEDHLTVIQTVQAFYAAYDRHPTLRRLIQLLEEKWDKQKVNSTYLYTLFPEGPIQQASALGGLPKPIQCI